VVRSPGSWGPKSLAKPATLVITGSDSSKPAIEVTTGSGEPANNSKAATSVITGFLLSGQIWRRTASARPAAVNPTAS